ncbi:MAG: AI-2E family transporter [Rhodanobacteraceae bacterium]|nr:AI-2E family transporter [Rhodanobacteraceae bacterium]MBL0040458.1 AI-2E family transporter [Xanthomonadales bacterium]MBP6078091.1 AI-2E family transporter [Xanthomonadales bacterium]MBP7622540.1 AI-2E family transporter [Xanthomonadales bacterium]
MNTQRSWLDWPRRRSEPDWMHDLPEASTSRAASASDDRLASISRSLVALLLLAALVVLWAAQALLIPLTMAALIAISLSPVVGRLSALMPRSLASFLLMAVVVMALTALLSALVEPAQSWVHDAPELLRSVTQKLKTVTSPIAEVSRAVAPLAELANGGPQVATADPANLSLVGMLKRAPELVLNAVVILLLSYFLLVHGDALLRKAVTLAPTLGRKRSVVGIVREIQHGTARYLATTVAINTGLALLTTAVLWAMGLPDPLLWGVFAGLSNFIPYVGATVVAVLLAMVGLQQADTLSQGLMPAAAFLLLTTIEGQLVTPQLLGRQLRLNPVAVLVWMMAWGWMWGLAGLLLAVPMLVCLKTVCEHVTACRWLALILEDGPRISQGRSHRSVQDATDASPQAID